VKKMGFALRTSSRSEHNEKQRMWLSQSLAEAYAADEAPHTIMVKPVAEGRLTSGHGYRLSPTGVPIPRKHKGVDYAAPEGTPVFAADDGIVEKRYISKSYGNYIRIRHANGFSTAYAHLHSINNELQEGSKVNRGQKIAKVGSTGRSTGPHLHFEIIHNGTFIDPLFDRLKSKRAEGRYTESSAWLESNHLPIRQSILCCRTAQTMGEPATACRSKLT